MLATKVVHLRPYNPEFKGIVERRNACFEMSSMPGRSFSSAGDFNAQFGNWLTRIANDRVVRTIKARPMDLIGADRARMVALPPVPLHLGWRERVRFGRDYYVCPDASDLLRRLCRDLRTLDITVDLERVRARLQCGVVADRADVRARGATVTDEAYCHTAHVLRPAWTILGQAQNHGRVGYDRNLRHSPRMDLMTVFVACFEY